MACFNPELKCSLVHIHMRNMSLSPPPLQYSEAQARHISIYVLWTYYIMEKATFVYFIYCILSIIYWCNIFIIFAVTFQQRQFYQCKYLFYMESITNKSQIVKWLQHNRPRHWKYPAYSITLYWWSIIPQAVVSLIILNIRKHEAINLYEDEKEVTKWSKVTTPAFNILNRIYIWSKMLSDGPQT